ncbi:MAG: hypothetical protein RSC28_00780 [Bacteroidales bacterium]
MRYIISFSILFFVGVFSVGAQTVIPVQVDTVRQDSVIIVKAPLVDSTLVGISVFSVINSKNEFANSNVYINQPSYITNAFNYYIAGNALKQRHGYRIRIFFDNKQHARGESEIIVKSFSSSFPQVPVYRSYTNPYFKVVAGDFRTKSDAMRVLGAIKNLYPHALVIKEYIQFPPL